VSGFWCQRLKNINYQIANTKWFDKLTTLSQAEGQNAIAKIPNPKYKTS
jgi:hypothetical protein